MTDETSATFDVSHGAAYAVLYSVLVFFTILALGSAGLFNKFMPDSAIRCCFLANNSPEGRDAKANTDYFLSARNSAGVWAIGLSYFAAGMGAWVRSVDVSLFYVILLYFSAI